jgi:hypothetical protein
MLRYGCGLACPHLPWWPIPVDFFVASSPLIPVIIGRLKPSKEIMARNFDE